MTLDNILIAILAGCGAGTLYCIFMLIRNTFVFKARMAAIDFLYSKENWVELHKIFDKLSYDDCMNMWSAWCMTDFYPEFKE